MRFLKITSLLSFALWSVGATAQDGAATPSAEQQDEDLIVVGSKQEIRNELRSLFSESSNQLVRHERPFCPLIMGFDREYTPILHRLIKENAEAANLPVAKRPCQANAIIIFIDEPQELTVRMRQKYPDLYAGLSPYGRNKLLNPDRPFYAWHVAEFASSDGVPGSAGDGGGQNIGDSARGAPVFRNTYPSRLSENIARGVKVGFLLIDIDETEGKALGQIADFASLHLMLKLRDDAWDSARPGSMLRLFDVDDPTMLPARMDAFDRRMLQGLYALDRNDIRGSIQRGRIASFIKGGNDLQEQKIASEAGDEP